jgi:hypothetical protein
VAKVELKPGELQTLTLRHHETTETVRARWVVDASGRAAVLARKNGWWRNNSEHPTAAAWSRWKGVKDWDGRELAEKYPEWASGRLRARDPGRYLTGSCSGERLDHFIGLCKFVLA